MKNFKMLGNPGPRRVLIAVFTIVFILAITVMAPRPAQADKITPPAVPESLQVLDGSKLFLVGHATGTQNYLCLPAGEGFAFTLITPQATLFNENQDQIITHFFSPNPAESGTVRATWEDSRDTSTIWAKMVVSYNEPDFVAPGAISWLLLDVINHQDGPTGGSRLSATKHIQRLNTQGGIPPSTGCSSLTDVGNRAYVPYTADYYFYK